MKGVHIAVLDNASAFREHLLRQVRLAGAEVTVLPPRTGEDLNAFDGVIISGGSWGTAVREERRPFILWYKDIIPSIRRPVLGICQGALLLAYAYDDGQRAFRRLPQRLKGYVPVRFAPGFPLGQGETPLYHSTLTVIEAVDTTSLVPCATSEASPVEAFRHTTLPHFGLLPHIEVTYQGEPSPLLRRFIRLCQNYP
ncbi:Pyridoxal 5'-phosphate synthase subunit PdxT [bacterium HR23]|nr:Pyridoxal 5'-phosphate synthase subunit PdxT [bacterium HR23]